MLLVGIRLIPNRVGNAKNGPFFGSGNYQIEIVLEANARSVGKILADSPLLQNVVILGAEVFRDGQKLNESPDKMVLQVGDHLKLHCDLENFSKLKERRGIALRHENGRYVSEEAVLVEAVVAPGFDPGRAQPETGPFPFPLRSDSAGSSPPWEIDAG